MRANISSHPRAPASPQPPLPPPPPLPPLPMVYPPPSPHRHHSRTSPAAAIFAADRVQIRRCRTAVGPATSTRGQCCARDCGVRLCERSWGPHTLFTPMDVGCASATLSQSGHIPGLLPDSSYAAGLLRTGGAWKKVVLSLFTRSSSTFCLHTSMNRALGLSMRFMNHNE